MPSSYSEAVYRTVSKWTAMTRLEFVEEAKRPGTKSYERYQSYSKARCVGEALRLGAKPEDLMHDYGKKYCKMAKDQRIKVPAGVVGDEEKAIFDKFLKHMRGPAGCNIRKLNAKKLKAMEKLKKLGIDFKDMRDEKNCQETNDLQALRLAADCAAGEIMAEVERTGRKVLEKDLISVLDLWAFRKNDTRVNVLPEGKNWVNSDTLGLVKDRRGMFIATKPTKDYPSFMALLNRYLADRRPPELDCDFPFTTISLNFGYAAKRHRDSGNLGPSIIKGFGKFKGGSLCYWPDDDKSTALENLRDDDKVVLDISQGIALFDGNRAHEVEPFQGERYSLVFFSVDKFWKASDEVLSLLRERGYKIPTEESMVKARSLLPAPRGYSGCHSLTSMFGTREKPKVYQWFESQEDLNAAAAHKPSADKPSDKPYVPPAKPQQKSAQEPPKSADLKALFFGGPASGSASAAASSAAGSSSAASPTGSEEASAATSEEAQPKAAPEDSPKAEASQKNADVKAMLFGTSAPSSQKSTEAAGEPEKSEPSTPSATPPRKESTSSSKRPLGVSCEKVKRARRGQVAKAEAAAKSTQAGGASTAGEGGEPTARELASTQFSPEAVASGTAWCSRFSIIVRCLQAAEANPQAPTIALSNCFRAMLHGSQEMLSDLISALELLLQAAAEPLPPQVMAAALSEAFGAWPPAAGADLAEAAAAARCAASDRAPSPLTLAEALAEWRAARGEQAKAPAHLARLFLATQPSAEGGEAAALARLLLGRPGLSRPAVLRALAHAFALTTPPRAGAPAQRRAFGSPEAQQSRLVATDKALALAHGETGGDLKLVLEALLADCRPAEMFGRCGPRFGVPLLPMKSQETRDSEFLLSELTGSSVLVEQRYPGERVQVHKAADGRLSVFGPRQEVLGGGLGEALMAALGGAFLAKECIVEAVLQRDAGVLQVFDCLWLEGRSLVRQSLRQRRLALDQALRPCDAVQIPPSEEFTLEEPPTVEVLGSLLEEATSCGCKGVMLKRLDREYEAGATTSPAYYSLRLGSA